MKLLTAISVLQIFTQCYFKRMQKLWLIFARENILIIFVSPQKNITEKDHNFKCWLFHISSISLVPIPVLHLNEQLLGAAQGHIVPVGQTYPVVLRDDDKGNKIRGKLF